MHKKPRFLEAGYNVKFVQFSEIDNPVITCYHVATTKEKTKSQTEREDKKMENTLCIERTEDNSLVGYKITAKVGNTKYDTVHMHYRKKHEAVVNYKRLFGLHNIDFKEINI